MAGVSNPDRPTVQEAGCSAYDCEFVALAIQLDTRLDTMDGRLLRAFPERAMSLA